MQIRCNLVRLRTSRNKLCNKHFLSLFAAIMFTTNSIRLCIQRRNILWSIGTVRVISIKLGKFDKKVANILVTVRYSNKFYLSKGND